MQSIDFTKLKIGNYNRKSSESEDKQVLSIQSQIDEANRISSYYKLTPSVDVFQESRSAKKENKRPEFTRMMQMISSGKIDAIVCWKLDRLARNMTEGGQIIDLLSAGVIKAIITHDKVFYPWDNVLAMAVEFGQNSQFIKDLSSNVKRGQKTKAEKGVPHGVASLGFKNDKTEEKGNRKWVVDQERLAKIKILLDLFLTGTYSAGKLHRYAVNELKLTTVQRKRIGGCSIVLSRIYEILKDPVYAGFFYYGGQRYELDRDLPRLITEDQHNKIKDILAKNNIPKLQTHETTFSGFLVSEEGAFIGQDVKYQLICDCKYKFAYRDKTHCPQCERKIETLENPKYLSYTHYYNVKKKKAGQKYKSISEEKIKAKLGTFISENLLFSEELAVWSRQYIDELKDKEISENLFRKATAEADKAKFEHKKLRLRDMLRDEQITKEEYDSDLRRLQGEYANTEEPEKKIDWYSEMNQIVDLTLELNKTLEGGTLKAKRNLLSKLGSNLVWNDRELIISNKKSIDKLVEGIKLAREINPKFEPKNCLVYQGEKEKTEVFSSVFSTMLPG